MSVSINWLKKYVDFDWDAPQLAHALTMAGIAIEGVEDVAGDSIMELDLTPNRGDCLGLINLAREVAAVTGGKVSIPTIIITESDEPVENYIDVEIADPDLCHRYAARLVRGVKIAESPGWMQQALESAGIRPINNIVDITNYVMLETNQPLHAFDYRLLTGSEKKIVVRRAYDQETFITLDEMERELDSEMLVITDGHRAVALAGVMGGLNTEIKDDTRDVLIESAWFFGPNIRRTSRKLGLRTDSSQRFEKGTDIKGLIYALDRAAALMQELGGGKVAQGIRDAYPQPREDLKILLRPKKVNALLGTALTREEISGCLKKLNFSLAEEAEGFKVDVPSYRPDITMEVDLIEEVARIYGYDNIEATLPVGPTTRGGLSPWQQFQVRVKKILAQNLLEIVNYSFINPDSFDRLLLPQDDVLRQAVKVANPLSEEQGVMRTQLLPGLLKTVATNLTRKNESLAFFESGAVFYPSRQKLPVEKWKIGAIVSGNIEDNWLKHSVAMDFFYLKGLLENLLRQLGISRYQILPAGSPSYHPGRTAVVNGNGIELGIIGEIHPLVLQNYDIKNRCCALELDMEALFQQSQERVAIQEITRYPAVERDIAVLLQDGVPASEAMAIIREAEKELLWDVTVFDLYTGEQIAPGLKSIAFRLLFQSTERTLTEADINNSLNRILKNLQEKLQAALR